MYTHRAIPAIAAFTLMACSNNTAPAGPSARNETIVHVPLFIETVDHQAPQSATTPLYEVRKHNPILAPNGAAVTLAQFNAVNGVAIATCTSGGTRVNLQLTGLIPNGLYTFWNVVFKSPGFDPTFANLSGLGAGGPKDGSANAVRASATGAASITFTTPGGPLSVTGSIGACALTDQFEWHVVGAYHLDDMSHGATLGPDGSAVEQFGFIFKR